MPSPLPRRAPAIALLLAVLASLVVVSAPVRGDARPASAADQRVDVVQHAKSTRPDPRKTRGLFVDGRMKAAQAGPAFKRIGSRAQPLWITDAYSEPGRAVQRYVRRAAQAHKTPLMSIYNIPGRDCGMYSAQQLEVTGRQYRTFVARAAQGIDGTKPIVVVEPDAIPFIGNPSCDPSATSNWLALIRYATQQLTRAGAWVYIDAGHSGWQTAAHMAPLLKQAGIAGARGFSTNVANSRATTAELTYAKAVIRELAKLKVTGVKYVIDTSRNGVGAGGRPENGDVCNPTLARLGADPRLRFDGAFDANLWVKPPGESDGPCNDGPPSGEFFPDGACRLMGRSSYDTGVKACT